MVMDRRAAIFLFLQLLLRLSTADVGTAAQYGGPYVPTRCYGGDAGSLPANNLFAAATDSIWDNGAACGREYLVRCLSNGCVSDQTIQVRVVDYAGATASRPTAAGTTMVLSRNTFSAIARPSAPQINIEFQQV